MSLNLKKIRHTAKQRLNFEWEITFNSHTSVEWQKRNFPRFPAFTESISKEKVHHIHLNPSNVPNEIDLFHEFGHVKINEIGFLEAERHARAIIDDCTGDSPRRSDEMQALMWIAESYADSILYRIFQDKSKLRADGMIRRFTSPSAVPNMYDNDPVWGIVVLCCNRLSFLHAGLSFPDQTIIQRISESPKSAEISKLYSDTNSILSSLSSVFSSTGEIQSSIPSDIVSGAILEVFNSRTGLTCS